MNRDELIRFCTNKISEISTSLAKINSDRADALKFYDSDPSIVQIYEDRSKVTTSDLMDTVEWAMPAILEIFCGQDKFVAIEPTEGTDVRASELMDVLVTHQIKVKNDWFIIISDWIKDALLMKIGAIKYQWIKNQQKIEKEYQGLTEQEYQDIVSRENIEIVKVESIPVSEEIIDPESGQVLRPQVMNYNLVVNYIVEDEFPFIEAIPPEDFGIMPNVKSIDDADFVYHRIVIPKWKAKQIYSDSKVDWDDLKCGNEMAAIQGYEIALERERDIKSMTDFYDKRRENKLIIYECYFYDEKTGQPKIATICDGKVINFYDNKYGRPPFAAITPIKMSHRIAGKSFYDLIRDIQRLRTELLRQIVDNLYQNNFRRYFVDPDRVNLSDYLDLNTTNAAIRTKGDPRLAVMPEAKAPLPPELFQFWETLQVERDYHSGIPRSYQGVMPSVQHRTARGLNQQVQLASQRIQSIARLIGEMGIKPLIKEIVSMNIKFLSKKVMVRYLNDWIEISPDNIIGHFDIKVNVGIGLPDKETLVVQSQQLLGIFSQLFRAGIPVVNAQNVYNILRLMLNAMGLKNTGDFITDPKVIEGLKQLYMILAPSLAQNQELNQAVLGILAQAGVPMQELQQAVTAAMTQEQLGAEAPPQAAQPAQPMNPRITPTGRGFYG